MGLRILRDTCIHCIALLTIETFEAGRVSADCLSEFRK